jgi:Tfp pilus assembly protein PilP
MTMRLWFFALAIILAATAQAQAPPEEPAMPAAVEQEETTEIPLLEPADGYSYSSQGRRDPFVSLNRRIEGGELGERPEGVEGFLIQELALRGIVHTEEGYISMLEGPDAKSYFARVGQRVYDGVIIAMDGSTVTFRQDVTDPLSPVKTRELKKDLYPSEEATQ